MAVIRVDRSHRLIEVKMAGFFDVDRAQSLGASVIAAITSLGGQPNTHRTLYNLDELQVASAGAFAEMVASYASAGSRGFWAKRVACYSHSALVRMQMSRLKTARADFGVFVDRAPAIDWLLKDDREFPTMAAQPANHGGCAPTL